MRYFSTPIVLITFKRPTLVSLNLNIIKKIKPKYLYILSDGAKNNIEYKKVEQCRKIINKIKWCKFEKKFFEKNIGLKYIGPAALNWVFQKHKKAIILEDDTIPELSFFFYCEKLLKKYKDIKKISQISGTNILDAKTIIGYKELFNINNKESYFFSKYSNIWGWATWKDRWEDYDVEMKKWINFNKLKQQCYSISEYKWWKKMFNKAFTKKNYHDWDYQWTFANFLKERLSVVPYYNLICNKGDFDASGFNSKKLFHLQTCNMNFPMQHPKKIILNDYLDKIICSRIYSMPSLIYRIKKKLKNIITKLL
jgi:hypothetical protein